MNSRDTPGPEAPLTPPEGTEATRPDSGPDAIVDNVSEDPTLSQFLIANNLPRQEPFAQ